MTAKSHTAGASPGDLAAAASNCCRAADSNSCWTFCWAVCRSQDWKRARNIRGKEEG
jgi:hypothetical protein